MRFILLTFLTSFFLVSGYTHYSSALFAQEINATADNATPLDLDETEAPSAVPVEVNSTLSGLLDSIEELSISIKSKEKALKRAKLEVEREQLKDEIEQLSGILRTRLDNFEDIAAGVDLDEFVTTQTHSVDFTTDLKELMAPLLAELKDLTSRPRDLERLRAEVTKYNTLLEKLDGGLQRMATVRNATADDDLHERLDDLIQQWDRRRNDAASARDVAQLKLKEKLAENGSVVSVVQNLFQTFFLTRGKNLLLAVLTAVLVFTILRLALKGFMNAPHGKRLAKRNMFFRAATVAYTFLCGLLAILSGLSVLYFAGDWLLLGLMSLLVIGVIWSAKLNVAKFSEQVKLLCNLGSVREGERIVYEGLPYKVGRINYYTTLVNPLLQGGCVRLRLEELFHRTSRPVHKDEEWFPCRKEDWVVLNDGMYGQVLLQTPEEVVMSVWGGNRLHIPARDFLAMTPRNLTSGFGHFIVVGVDYKHQAEATEAIPNAMKDAIERGLHAQGYGDKIQTLLVEFKEAADSSLNFGIFAGFSGDVACCYWTLQRLVARLATQACTDNGWNIPFPQRTLHIASGAENQLPAFSQNDSTKDADVS